ncbi:MAG: peptidylprolyl isomerase [Planctomycetota bacterium]
MGEQRNKESISDGKVVTLHYTLTGVNGDVLDSTEGQDPFTYLHGTASIVPGLESQLTGQTAGTHLKLVVKAVDGYGAFDPDDVEIVPRSSFPADAQLETGMQIHVEDEEGEESNAWISAVDEDEVKLNFNHPLAGEELNFAIQILEVRAATREEIAHGHAHGAGGHHHH